jgi:hypothetical protein
MLVHDFSKRGTLESRTNFFLNLIRGADAMNLIL